MLHADSLASHDRGKINLDLIVEKRLSNLARKKTSLKIQQTQSRQDNGYDCGVFMLFFMERFNEALRHANGGRHLQDASAAL